MTDDEMTTCEWCGDEFKKQGIAAHKRYCDAEPTDGDDGEIQSDESSTVMDTVEEEARDRDGCQCQRCGVTEDNDDVDLDITVEVLNPNLDRTIANLVTLCEECAELVDGLHHLTKRTKIFFEDIADGADE